MGLHSDLEGADLHTPSNVKVENDTGTALAPLKIVKYKGFGTTNPTVEIISSLTDVIAGVVQSNIPNDGTGLITAFGNICEVDTSSFSVGQSLFATASGDLTTTPTDVRVGQVLKVDADLGVIFINSVTISNTFRTDAEIKIQYENNANTNEFSDQEKTDLASFDSLINSNLLTSLVSGCEITVNGGDSTKFDMAAGVIYVTTLGGPSSSSGAPVIVAAQTEVAHPVGASSRIVLTSSGTLEVETFTGLLTQAEKVAGKTQIGILGHTGGLVSSPITQVFTTISAVFGDTPASNADMFATGVKKMLGLGLQLNADLTFDRLAGDYFEPLAANFHSAPTSPYDIVLSQEDVVTFFSTWMGDDISSVNVLAAQTDIDPDSWDDPTLTPGVGSPSGILSGNQAQNFSVHEGKDDSLSIFGVQYGRVLYATLSDAVVGAVGEMNSRDNSFTLKGTSFRGIISVPRAATNLLTQAVFTAPSSRLITTL